jgi:tetratricopeptide (TPR) repeat protein
MPAQSVDWLPALSVLAAGLVVGFVFLRRIQVRGGPAPAVGQPLEARDLLARRDALIAQLRELEDLAAKREPSQLARERWELEHEAARVLRQLDRVAATRSARVPVHSRAAPPVSPQRAAWRGFLWGTGTAAVVGLLLFLVSRLATERVQGGSPTGGDTPPTAASADPILSALRLAVQRNPDDIDARLKLARAALARQQMMEAFEQTRGVLERAPGHPLALSYEALVHLEMGQARIAESMLEQALATDPNLLEAYVNLTLVYVRMGRRDAARAAIEEAARRHPSRATSLRLLWSELRAQAAQATEAARRAPSAGRSVSGSVALAPGFEGQVPADAVVFIIVRRQGVIGGPPVAAKRLPASAFPASFELSAADSMLGADLPDRIHIEARVDHDGNAATRDPGALTAVRDGVLLGATDIELLLRE